MAPQSNAAELKWDGQLAGSTMNRCKNVWLFSLPPLQDWHRKCLLLSSLKQVSSFSKSNRDIVPLRLKTIFLNFIITFSLLKCNFAWGKNEFIQQQYILFYIYIYIYCICMYVWVLTPQKKVLAPLTFHNLRHPQLFPKVWIHAI